MVSPLMDDGWMTSGVVYDGNLIFMAFGFLERMMAKKYVCIACIENAMNLSKNRTLF